MDDFQTKLLLFQTGPPAGDRADGGPSVDGQSGLGEEEHGEVPVEEQGEGLAAERSLPDELRMEQGDGVDREDEAREEQVGEGHEDDQDGGGIASQLLVGAENKEHQDVEDGPEDSDGGGGDSTEQMVTGGDHQTGGRGADCAGPGEEGTRRSLSWKCAKLVRPLFWTPLVS